MAARGRGRGRGRPGTRRETRPGTPPETPPETRPGTPPETPGPALPGRPRRRRPAGQAGLGSSHGAADGRATKRLKREKDSLVKSELKGVQRGSGNLASLGEAPKASDGDGCSEDPGDCSKIPEKKGESIPEPNEDRQEEHSAPLEPRALRSSHAPSVMDSKEESSCESLLSEGPSLEDTDLKKPRQLDSSAFLDEDSNQPMPVARFFGDVELLRDLPAVALPSTATSRREFRKLHFIAKEDEEEEEEDVA
ncbi:UPF0688 protein C1orf174 homolog [Apus apus]|uniref:UPF0688 protein C1orf174 homolog n=1 Tax=Apus apus TaxID=8895 RepID=UPI0021F81E1F|nr:UPF0688 protein C1orf174 homolog [Apus apus]XP_051493404.1 UPF0688 protein C1orf174 homolog [Apus apus]